VAADGNAIHLNGAAGNLDVFFNRWIYNTYAKAEKAGLTKITDYLPELPPSLSAAFLCM
jgi:hypothetical protein